MNQVKEAAGSLVLVFARMFPLALLKALAAELDFPSCLGRRHPLPALLPLTVLAVLCVCKGSTATSQFGCEHSIALAHALGFGREVPVPLLFRYLQRAT